MNEYKLAWTQVFGQIESPTTTSINFISVPDMIAKIKSRGYPLKISYNLSAGLSLIGKIKFQLYVDGRAIGQINELEISQSNINTKLSLSDSIIIPSTNGNHIIELYWCVTNGSSFISNRNLLIEELTYVLD